MARAVPNYMTPSDIANRNVIIVMINERKYLVQQMVKFPSGAELDSMTFRSRKAAKAYADNSRELIRLYGE